MSLPAKRKKIDRRLFLGLVVFFFATALPTYLLLKSVLIFKETSGTRDLGLEKQAEPEEELTPSEILNNKSKYKEQTVTIRGKVSPEPVVCER